MYEKVAPMVPLHLKTVHAYMYSIPLCTVGSFYCCCVCLNRYLLGFGRVSQYVGYNAMDDFFPSMSMKPNPQCSNSHCRQKQEEHRKYLETHPLPVEEQEVNGPEVVHESNEWGM